MRRGHRLLPLVNAGLRRRHTGRYARPLPNPLAEMSTLEQRITYFHLLDAVLAYQVPGEVVELGGFTGQGAELFQRVLSQRGGTKQLHLYDSFEVRFTVREPVEDGLRRSFAQAGLPCRCCTRATSSRRCPPSCPPRWRLRTSTAALGAMRRRTKPYCCTAWRRPRLSPGAGCGAHGLPARPLPARKLRRHQRGRAAGYRRVYGR